MPIVNLEKDCSSPSLKRVSHLGFGLRREGSAAVQETVETTIVSFVRDIEVLSSVLGTIALVQFEESIKVDDV